MTQRKVWDLVRHGSPVVLPPDTSVQAACRAMRERRVGAVLVVDGGRLVGIFTGRDAVARVLAEGRDAATTTLGEVMTGKPVVVEARCTAMDALRLMEDCGHRHLPVLEAERLLGCISRGDFRGLEHARLDEETGLWERI
jgi:CBS domain-containing protein